MLSEFLSRAAEDGKERRQGGDAGLFSAELVGRESPAGDAGRLGDLVLPTTWVSSSRAGKWAG